jgi:hypothetical protein
MSRLREENLAQGRTVQDLQERMRGWREGEAARQGELQEARAEAVRLQEGLRRAEAGLGQLAKERGQAEAERQQALRSLACLQEQLTYFEREAAGLKDQLTY